MDRILLALDGSRRSEAAIPPAAALCRAFGSELVLLRTLRADSGRPLECRIATAEARAYLRGLLRSDPLEGLSVRSAVTLGDPVEETLRLAGLLDVELIVIHCTCGDPRHRRMDGHVYSIASGTSASLLVVRDQGEDVPKTDDDLRAAAMTDPSVQPWPRKILVPVDGSPRGDWAACKATQLAEPTRSEVILAHVVSAPDLLSPHRHPNGAALLSSLTDHVAGLARDHLRRMRSRLSGGSHSIRTRVVVSRNVPRALDQIARDEEVDLTVLSAHGWSPEADWIHGSVAEGLMAHGSTALLVFQDWPADSRATAVDQRMRSRPDRLAEAVVPPNEPTSPRPSAQGDRPFRWRRR